MAWIDDRIWCHPKLTDLSDGAWRVFVSGIAYSSGMGTKGMLTSSQQKLIGARDRTRVELIAAGLWDAQDDGAVFIHDWEEHNGKRDERKRKDRERKREAYHAQKTSAGESAEKRPEKREESRALTGDRVTEDLSVTPNGVPAERRLENAGDVVGAVVALFAAKGVPIPNRHRGMLGKQAKDLLASEFTPEDVTLACVIALRRGEPQNAHFIASDLVQARAGSRLTRREYEKALQDEMEVGRGAA